MKDLKTITGDALADMGIFHYDDIEEVLECIENDCVYQLRHNIYITLEANGYNMEQ